MAVLLTIILTACPLLAVILTLHSRLATAIQQLADSETAYADLSESYDNSVEGARRLNEMLAETREVATASARGVAAAQEQLASLQTEHAELQARWAADIGRLRERERLVLAARQSARAPKTVDL